MLVRSWITERVAAGTVNFECLARELVARAAADGIDVSDREIRVVLERLIRAGEIETCQFLAEDQRYAPTVYDDSNIWYYWFRLRPAPAEGERA